jgi:hypothetical protein
LKFSVLSLTAPRTYDPADFAPVEIVPLDADDKDQRTAQLEAGTRLLRARGFSFGFGF